MAVTARGSMFCSGLLMKLMKLGKLWLPVSRPPSACPEQSALDRTWHVSVFSVGKTTEPFGVGVPDRNSWAWTQGPSTTRISELHAHFMGELLFRCPPGVSR